MQTVAMKPRRADWAAMSVGLTALCIGMLLVPALCAPLALGVPLLACPLAGRKEEPLAWFACAVPALSSLLAGYHAAYAISLVLIGLLPMIITKAIPLPKRPGAKGMLLYIAAMTISLALVLATAAYALGGPLQVTLPEKAVEAIGSMKNPALMLHQLASMGLLNLPDGYAGDSLMRPLMQSAYNQQMLMSLRLTLEMLVSQLLPGLFVQACLITGLFTALRLERVSGVVLVVEAKSASEKQTRVIAPPSFRLLAMPRQLRWMAIAMFIAAFGLILSVNPVLSMLGRLFFATAQTLFELLGAAIVVFLITRHDPDRRTGAGIAAVALYVLLPQILLLIGIVDRAMNFRKPPADKPD